jgi:hypothetical protein
MPAGWWWRMALRPAGRGPLSYVRRMPCIRVPCMLDDVDVRIRVFIPIRTATALPKLLNFRSKNKEPHAPHVLFFRITQYSGPTTRTYTHFFLQREICTDICMGGSTWAGIARFRGSKIKGVYSLFVSFYLEEKIHIVLYVYIYK